VARMVVIADDLTGAADCAAPSAAFGHNAVVVLHSHQHQQSAAWPDTDILSIDANCRCLSSERSAELIAQLVRLCHSRNRACPEYVLYKKIDSTLRGNVAREVAALLYARRSLHPANTKLSILMAPALPAHGRTIVRGRLLVHGVPLENTDIWQSESRPAQSDVVQLLADAGLSCHLIDRSTVRSGLPRLQQAILQSATQVDVVLCDSETDDDLRAIATASLGDRSITAWAGSAGLASQIPQAIGIAPGTQHPQSTFASGATLFIVGSAAPASRQQARILEAIPNMTTFHATPAALHHSRILHTGMRHALQRGRDVLLTLDPGLHCSSDEASMLSQAFAHLLSPCASLLGAVVATGGETARAALEALGIEQLRLIGEVEAGLAFSVGHGWAHPLPIITKAGAFGSPHALVRCREFLRALERAPAHLHPNDPFVHRES
jgi:D-threonate/D-erythronate kinase